MTPVTSDNPYSRMQREFYERESAKWSPENRDPVVGTFDKHNEFWGYGYLFKDLETAGKIALDFGCGPGRNIVKYHDCFARIDGADIAAENLTHAARWCVLHKIDPPKLYLTNGIELDGVPSDTYDFVFSTICLQHICVHAIRRRLFLEFNRVLKPGGWFTAQMGYGDSGDMRGYDFYADQWDAQGTNSACDVKVANWVQLESELGAARFDPSTASYTVTETGPGDWHPNWIFFRAKKWEAK